MWDFFNYLMKYGLTDPDPGQLFSLSKHRVLSGGLIEEFIPHDMYERCTCPAGELIEIRQLKNC
jgi:hypothetical protein